MNNQQAFPRNQFSSAEPVSARHAVPIDPLFNWFALLLLVLSLSIASVADAQTTTGSVAAGTTLYNANCDGCHGATPGATVSYIEILNAANAGGVINNAMSNSMGGFSTGSFTATQENDLAAYIANFVTQPNPVNSAIAHNTATLINIPNLYINSTYGSFTTGTSSGVSRGSVVMSVSGSTLRATYTPTTGQCGTDTFYVRATNGGAYTSNLRELSVDITDPATPNISTSVSPRTATYNSFSSFSPTSTGGASTNWDISSGALPTGMSINSTTGVISGIPTVVGSFVFTLRARNCLSGDLVGRSGTKSMTITVNKASQGAITALVGGSSAPSAFTFSPGATAALTNSQLSPVGTGAVSYAVTTATPAGTCTITAGTTLNLVTAGSCTVTVTRATDTNYLVVSDTVNVTINKANQTALVATATPLTLNFAANSTLSTTGGSGTGLVSYVSNNGNCSIASTTLTGAAVGTCIVTATKAADTNYNSTADATPTITVNAIVPGAPTGVTASGGDTSATVSFTAPASNGGSAITGYTVTSSPSGGVDSNAGTTGLTHTITGLTNGVTYTFTVRATNVAGQGAASSASNGVTPANTPVAPTITSGNNKTFTVFTAGTTHTVTATGFPSPVITHSSGTLPAGLTFPGGTGSGVLSGTPSSGAAVGGTMGTGSYTVEFKANNASGTVTQSFTITVNKATQALTFSPPTTQEFSPNPIPISASATLAPITFSTTTGTTVSVSGSTFTTLELGNGNLIAEQAGNADYNAISSDKKDFVIVQGSQTISFVAQAAKTYSPGGVFALSGPPTASSGRTVRFTSNTPGVCNFADAEVPQVTIITAGTCMIDADQAGSTNYLPADTVAQSVVINQVSQTISWGAPSNQPFGLGGSFAISPLASGGTSGNSIVYGSLTPAVCTVSGTTVSKVAIGTCTLTANQSGDGQNYTDAAQVSRSLQITASVPSAPTATQVTPSDSQIIVDFDPPSSNGGSAITGFTAACGPSGNAVAGATSPITVTGLTNNTLYNCAVQATNAAGNSAISNILTATPILDTGANLWTNVCANCHDATPSGVRFNAAGTTGNVINYVRSIQPAMLAQADVQVFTLAELAEIEKYIGTFVPAIATSTAFNTPVMIDVASHLTLGTVSFTDAAVVTPPMNGSLSVFTGTQITYTPTPGFVGIDTFTYRGTRSGPTVNGDPRTVTITVNPPSIPIITSPAIAAGTFNTPFAYQITATNSPTSFGASPLGANFSINGSGLVSGTPMVPGLFMVTISATNAGGTAMQNVDITISKANQTITFDAQGGQSFSPGGSFPLNPVASASSALTVSYSSLTPSICTISTTTVTILTAGTCTIAADQAGNANYEAALQVLRTITIAATVPGAPTIGTATPGDTVAAIGFTPPSNNGGSAITSYGAVCNPGSLTGSGDASPVMVSGLTNDTAYTCAVRATNATGNSAFSGTVMVTPTATPVAPQISSANATTFTVGAPGTFTVTATGTPTPTLALVGTLPTGVSFTPGTGALAGTPALGQVGGYPVSITATGTAPAAMQAFTLTVQKADQTISFTGPASQPITSAPIPLTATASSGLTVTLTSNTPSVCSISTATLTLLTVGTCSISASRIGDANYNAATTVTQGFTVSQASQTITFNAQVSNRSFVAGSTFAIGPTATASSNLAVIYSSTTTGICTVVGTNVTMVAPGTCTIAANQSGSANFLAATQATQNVQLDATVPGAPTIGTATGGNAQATVNFTAPANNGGSAITSYRATCNPGNVFVDGAASPIVVSSLANNVVHSCSVTAANGVGTGAASATVAVTPLSGQGAALWTQVCDACHTAVPAGNQLNGAGVSATVLDYVRTTQPTMSGISANAQAVQALSLSDLADIATYIASVITPNAVTTTVNTAALINLNNHITLTNQAWSSFTSIEIMSGPTNGTLGAFTGTQITYTPTPGFVGIDTFTYRGTRSGPTVNGDPQTVTISVNPPKPVITSAATANGTLAQAFGYQIAATNVPTSFLADGLPGGLSMDTAGLISGVPTVPGQFSVAISALNAGGSGDATLMLQIAQIAQVISFGAQSSPRTFSVGGTFAITPLASGGASLSAIVYGSNTPSVCTVSGTTVTMVAAGICSISADQPGDATYAAAVQVTQNVTIDPGPQTVTVTINGNGSVTGTGFACPGDCSESVTPNSVVALTAAASSGSTFSGWSGTCGGTPAGFTYTTNPVAAACSVIATFVQAANSTTTLVSSLNPSNVSQLVTLTATVSGGVGTPTGTVVFRDGANVIAACASITLSAGIAQCTTTTLSSGARSITAQYSGDAIYNASTSSVLAQTVKGSSLEAVIYLLLDD